ncbi:MAG: tRNA pseudouridine(38-40) synthase TruA [Candidatus Poribacteria bacterium]|nr:tRNA pseudouridine(38-40) synthase TruA [Candidatus Poribacteria bacterium]MDE0503056.1 tRNA pseudouridine(38-40) synthase TruA [Candidatus Poribacteria bacterium]
MRNIKLTIEYDGTNYHGWQIQPNGITVQEVIQNALAKLTKTKTQIIGAGRTDTGVHAAGQVANFLTDSELSSDSIRKALNSLVPNDVAITEVQDVPQDFHARFSALSRTYRYTILNREFPSAFLGNTAYLFPRPIQTDRIDDVCGALIGKKDFSSFQRTGSERINPVCTVLEASCWRDADLVYIQIEADAFLRGMVRALVGTVLKLQKAPDQVGQFQKILDARDRSAAGPSAPAHGLSLITVKY